MSDPYRRGRVPPRRAPQDHARLRISKRRDHNAGFTLAELVVSTISAMTLLAGLTSAIFIASRAASPTSNVNLTTSVSLTLDEIATELRSMKRVSSRSTTAIAFSVDDRSTDNDSADESISYAWDGIRGGSITRTYNGVPAKVITGVYSFTLGSTIQTDPGTKLVLFLQGNVTGTEATYDNTRVQLMQGWGYTVLRKTTDATTTQAELEAAAACVDVIYVSTSLLPDDLNTKLRTTPKGIILEEPRVADSFGLTSTDGAQVSETELKISDNTHYITSPFDKDEVLKILTTASLMSNLTPNYASGLKTYGTNKSGIKYPMLAIVDQGGMLTDNSPAAGPRIFVPWGGDGINPAVFDSEGKTLWRRTLDWSSGKKVLTSIELVLQTALRDVSPGTKKQDSWLPGAVIQTRAELIGRPRP